ncbi:glycoside hydrolase superfamily [Sporodiniella umbellata]|nr:glycoside hydrolase superfamily [Sporodiniella umbellata]
MATSLVSQMTLEQKVNITTGIGWEAGPCVGNSGRTTNPDFPELCLQDSPLGVRFADLVSSGVAGINAAASFDRIAIRRRGEYMAAEFRAKGAHAQLGPSMNMMRCPESGRNWEAFGEDPFLVGVASVETIHGIQSQGVHSVRIDERTVQEIYLWPFSRSVEADVVSVMCGYNKLNGIYSCESDYALNKLLKGQMGFRGFVQSDWSATHSTATSVKNGLDMTMPGDITFHSNDSYFGSNLTKAVLSGEVDESRVTDMATRIAAAWYKNFPKTNFDSFRTTHGSHIDVQGDHKKEIRHMGAISTVLLKNNDKILPLRESSIRKIAIIGSDAGSNPDGINCEDHGCNKGTLAQGWGSGTAYFPYLITPSEGIKSRIGKNIDVVEYLKDDNYEAASKIAAEADIAIVFVNADSGEEFVTVEGHKGDRNHLGLWNHGESLIHAVAGSNENTIVVVHSVGPVIMPWVNHKNVKAILWPGLPGQESGNAIADVLFGDINPSARLPYTIAKEATDYPAKISRELEFTYSEGMYIGYRWFDREKIVPQYEFGYGLSYTSFEYSQISADPIVGSTDDPDNLRVRVRVKVRNIGQFDGAEIPQLYLSYPEVAEEPPRILRGFEKVYLKTGEETHVMFDLKKTELSYYNVRKHSWTVPSGEFIAHVGSSSRNIKGTVHFTL